MKTIRLVRGTDILDLRETLGDATYKTAGGREVPKFVLHALESRSPLTDDELRGHPVEVNEKQAEELLTFPNLVVEEVDPEKAHADRYLRTLGRDFYNRLIDPTTGSVIDGPPPPAPPVAAGQARDPEEIKREVAAEIAAQKAAESALGDAAQGEGASADPPATGGEQGDAADAAKRRGR